MTKKASKKPTKKPTKKASKKASKKPTKKKASRTSKVAEDESAPRPRSASKSADSEVLSAVAALDQHLAGLVEVGRYVASESDRLRDDLTEARARIKDLEAKVDTTLEVEIRSRLLEEQVSAATHSVDEAQAECGEAREQVEGLREELITGRVRVAVLQERNGELMAQRAAVEDQMKKLEASYRDQRKVHEESRERAESETEHVRADLAKAQATISALEEQLKESAETIITLRGEMGQVGRLRAELATAEETLETLQDQIDAATDASEPSKDA